MNLVFPICDQASALLFRWEFYSSGVKVRNLSGLVLCKISHFDWLLTACDIWLHNHCDCPELCGHKSTKILAFKIHFIVTIFNFCLCLELIAVNCLYVTVSGCLPVPALYKLVVFSSLLLDVGPAHQSVIQCHLCFDSTDGRNSARRYCKPFLRWVRHFLLIGRKVALP